MRESKEHTVKFVLSPKKLPKFTKTELKRLDKMKDEDIDYSDIPSLSHKLGRKVKNVGILHIDADVLMWLKSKKRYQTCINTILRKAMLRDIKTNQVSPKRKKAA